MRLFVLLLLAFVFVSCGNDTPKQTDTTLPLPYETVTMVRTYQDCNPKDSNCTAIAFSYPQFSEGTKLFRDSMSALILRVFSDPSRKLFSPDSVQQVFISDYDRIRKHYPEQSHAWTLEKDMKVIHMNKRWIALEVFEFGYAGGAHPNETKTYFMLDRETGKQLLLTHFFDSAAIYKLYTYGEPIFCEIHHIKPDQGFDEAGFWFPQNHFRLNNNFYIDDEGITFYYNTYEVGPYVNGPTRLTIPASRIAPLLHSESPDS